MSSTEISMQRLAYAEWLKFAKPRGMSMAILCAILFGVVFAGIFAYLAISEGAMDAETGTLLLSAPGGILLIVLMIVGAFSVTTEMQSGTLRATYLAMPRRAPVMASKLLLLTGTALGAMVLALGAAYLSGLVVTAWSGHDFAVAGGAHLRELYGCVVAAPLYVVLGAAAGYLLRSTAAAVAAVLLWPLVLEAALGQILPHVGPYLPFTAMGSFLTVAETGSEAVPAWVGLAIYTAFTAALTAAAFLREERRDVTG